MQFERTRLINGVCVEKRTPPPPIPHTYSHAHARPHRQVRYDTNDILFVMWTNIMYYGPNCFCTLLCAHTHTGNHQI